MEHLFRDYVLTNVHYWGDVVTNSETSPDELARARQRIVTAIGFGLELEDAWSDTAALIIAFATYMERSGHWSTWQPVLTRAIQIAQTIEDKPTEVEFSILLARLLFRQNQTDAGVRQYRRTVTLARCAGDRYNEARAFTNLGYLFVEAEQWWRAEVLCYAALRIFDELDNAHGQAHTHNHLGSLYLRQYDWEKAQYHLEQACGLWEKMGDNHGLMRGYLNLSAVHIEAEDAKNALHYSKKALKHSELVGETSEIGAIHLNLSFAYLLKGETVQAEQYARQAETQFRRYLKKHDLAVIWGILGKALLVQHQFEKSKPYLEAALIEVQELDYTYGEIQALLALIKYEQVVKQFDQAKHWISLAETRISQLSHRAQRDHFHKLLAQYSHA